MIRDLIVIANRQPGFIRSSRALTALLCVLLVLTGCTAQFLYNRVDTFIVWQIEDYVGLTGEQKQALKSDIQDRLNFVRENELLRAAEIFERSARDLEANQITAALLDQRYYESLEVYDDLMLGIVPLSQRFLRSLDEDQVEEFFANLDEVNDEMYDEFSGRTAETRERNRNKSAVKSIQEFTGRLKKEQRLLVTEALANMDDASEQWIAYQRLWQEQFRELITQRPPEAEYHDRLTKLFVYPRNLHSEEYRERVQANRMILNAMLEELLGGLSDRQRRRAVRKLDGYAEMMRDLAASG